MQCGQVTAHKYCSWSWHVSDIHDPILRKPAVMWTAWDRVTESQKRWIAEPGKWGAAGWGMTTVFELHSQAEGLGSFWVTQEGGISTKGSKLLRRGHSSTWGTCPNMSLPPRPGNLSSLQVLSRANLASSSCQYMSIPYLSARHVEEMMPSQEEVSTWWGRPADTEMDIT